MNEWVMAVIAGAVGALVCRLVTAGALRDPPAKLVRTNVDGRAVPAVLGWGVAAGILAGHLVWAVNQYLDVLKSRCVPSDPGEVCPLVLIVFSWKPWIGLAVLTLGMFAVGLWDDLKGDERPRGFGGHLASLRAARWTGGSVKLVGGSLAALLAVALLGIGDTGLGRLVMVGACAALAANLINLCDRAPGRASKFFLVLGIPLALFGVAGMKPLLGAAIGASVASLPLDLRARAMLGDSGANPLGAILGLGLGIEVGTRFGNLGLVGVLAVLLALNLASEKWSFSEVIAKNRVLAHLDHLGRE